jgi:predicted amidohydrolase YtcJ
MATAQRIFTSGKVVTVDAAFSIRSAIAVAGERILAVGGDALTPLPRDDPPAEIACPATRLTTS